MEARFRAGDDHAAEAGDLPVRRADGKLNRTPARRKGTEVDDHLDTRGVAADEGSAKNPADAAVTLAKGPERTRRSVNTLERVEPWCGALLGARESNGEDNGEQRGEDSEHTQGYRPGAGAAGNTEEEWTRKSAERCTAT